MRHFIRSLIVTAALATLASALSVYPHELAYFNELAGGPRNGHLHLLHSNLDWGQDLLRAAEWERQHPMATPSYHLLMCLYDARMIGVQSSNLLTPYLCEFLLEKASKQEIFLLLSKQMMLEQSECLSRFDSRVIDTIGMSIVVISIRAQQSHG